MYQEIPVVIVAGMGRTTRALGKGNELLWHVPEDLKRFRALTLGHPVIMGRKTFESILAILGHPLPGRTNIVVTRDETYQVNGAIVAHSLAEALDTAASEAPREIHIGGGAELYRQALPLVDRVYLTYFDDSTPGDVTFPEFESSFAIETAHEPCTYGTLTYQWVDYVRKKT
jgi:dihydrofolate reductase